MPTRLCLQSFRREEGLLRLLPRDLALPSPFRRRLGYLRLVLLLQFREGLVRVHCVLFLACKVSLGLACLCLDVHQLFFSVRVRRGRLHFLGPFAAHASPLCKACCRHVDGELGPLQGGPAHHHLGRLTSVHLVRVHSTSQFFHRYPF